MAVDIENWAIVSDDSDPYLAPEIRPMKLTGRVYGHERIADGQIVTTSRIVETNGRKVTTASGTEYLLWKPSCEYVEWCNKHGHIIDEKQPVKLLQAA